MGCFLSCFRGRPGPSGDGLQDPLVRRSRLGDAFLDDHDGEDTAKLEAGGGTLKEDLGNGGGLDDELRREANYLKSCGAISETPPEILKVSNQIEEEYSNECNATFNNAQEIKGVTVSEDKDYSSEGFNCDGHGALSPEQNTGEGADHVGGVESEPGSLSQDKSSSENIRNQKLDSSDSPFPTPLVLRGDIQTPGTMFTAYQGNFKSGKRGRTGRQFIYPVLRPIENKLQWMELRDESSPVVASHPPKRRYSCADSTENFPQQTFPSSVPTDTEPSESAPFSFHANSKERAKEVTSPEETRDQNGNQQLLDGGVGELLKNSSYSEKPGVASLSSWLKTSYGDGENLSGIGGNVGKQQGFERITDVTDVPIFVASGLNCNDDNPTPMLPKAWDGNGIPNTTTKYKEDQRVNWHATPFEERLMKVLSDEKPKHERKMSGKLIHLEEDAE
ncbi:unnamed protein product [Alopecurus aequalis]